MKKITVIIFINTYLPGVKSGGPIRSIVNLIEHLGRQIDFKIITSDRDLGDANAYSNIAIDDWNIVGNASVFFMSPKYQNMKNMLRILKETPHDIIYINSFFNFRFSIILFVMRKLKLFTSPILIAPRGEFMDGAINIKRLKKKIFLFVSYLIGLYDSCTWQASNNMEADFIKKCKFLRIKKLIIVSNLPSVAYNNIAEHSEKRTNFLRICYIARISEKKNLYFIFEILNKVKHNIIFDIYGPIGNVSYWNKCQTIINQMSKNISISYKGIIDHSIVVETIKKYDLFFMPTYGENFGHSIIEAMLAGTPVLISNTTPWRDLASAGVGWDKSLDKPQGFLDVINQLVPMTEDDYFPLRKKVFIYAENYTLDKGLIQKHLNMFLSVHANASLKG